MDWIFEYQYLKVRRGHFPYFELVQTSMEIYPLSVLKYFNLFLKGKFQKHVPCHLQINLPIFSQIDPQCNSSFEQFIMPLYPLSHIIASETSYQVGFIQPALTWKFIQVDLIFLALVSSALSIIFTLKGSSCEALRGTYYILHNTSSEIGVRIPGLYINNPAANDLI